MTLNDEDVKEFKELLDAEFGGHHTDGEAREMATRLLDLCLLLAMPVAGESSPSHTEHGDLTQKQKSALTFIRHELAHGRQPSVRDIAKAVGLRSSRSGVRIRNSLIKKGLLLRKGRGELVFT